MDARLTEQYKEAEHFAAAASDAMAAREVEAAAWAAQKSQLQLSVSSKEDEIDALRGTCGVYQKD